MEFFTLPNFFCLKSQNFQNLVPNGSFETYTSCPSVDGTIFNSPPWTGPTINSSDYFNSCSQTKNVPYYGGTNEPFYFLPAKDGNGYAAIYVYQPNNYREYLETNLNQILIAGGCYYVEFYAANCQYVKYKTNNIAASFSSTSSPTNLSYPGNLLNYSMSITNYSNTVLEDTVKWHKISGLYTAVGSENYLVIGNFKDNSNTDTINIYQSGQTPYYGPSLSYIFIDAVSVFSINPSGVLPWAYNDTTVILGDSVYIGNTMGGNFNPQWFTIGGSYITTNAGIYVKPAATTSYVVNYTVCGTPRSDTIQVTVIDDSSVTENELRKMQFKAFPNPAKDELVIEFETDFTKPREIKIIDVLGKEVKKVLIQNKKQKINIEELSNGVYYLQLLSSNGLKITKKLVKE